MALDLQGKVIVITGASGGIGAALALALGPLKTKLVLAARTTAALEKIAETVTSMGSEALVVPTDMGQPDQVRALAQTVIAHHGRIDILVNNAGYGQYGPLSELTEVQIREQFEVNVIGLLLLTQQFIPVLRTQRQGRIVNISSIAGVVTLPFSGLYHATKHALEALTDALRLELAPFAIEVVAIQPGPVKTNFFEAVGDKNDHYQLKGSPYEALYAKVQAQHEDFLKQSMEVQEVIAIIMRALTDTPPQDRYLAFSGGPLTVGLLRNLPNSLKDPFLKGQFGLDRSL